MAVPITGIGSGIDIESLVTQLVAAERSPAESRLTTKEAKLTAQLSAFGAYKGALSVFQSSLSKLNNIATFGQRSASSNNEDVVTISASADAAAANYDIAVTQLAKPHSLASGSYTSTSDVVGTGTLTLRFGTTDYTSPNPGPESYNSFSVNPERGVVTINIDSSNNTLEGIRAAINDADIGISAAIVNDGSGYRLLINSLSTGAENSIEISVDDTGDSNNLDNAGLSALAFNSSSTNLTQTVTAQDAIFSINGLTINSSENKVSEAITGVNLYLKGITGSTPTTLSIEEDRASVKAAITSFVGAYNSFISTVNNLTAYDPDTGRAGALQGDFSARSSTSQLRQVLASSVNGFSAASFGSLSEIGITTKADGTLNLNTASLDAVLGQNFDEVVGLFAAVGFTSDNDINFISATNKTAVSNFAVTISQMATQAQLVGAAVTFPLTINNDNDAFTIKVDGITSNSISITQGNYANSVELAAELQSRINGDNALSAAGARVTVAFNGNQFEISSNSYGSESTIEILSVDTNTTAELGLSVGAGTNGVDVAGMIGGMAAVGNGQLLTGAVGSAAEGLKISIQAGVIGDRGSLSFSRGIAYQLNEMIANFLKSDGSLSSRTDGIQDRIKDIGEQRETLNFRMMALEARFRSQFNALDGLLAQLKTTSDFLTQQLASLPRPGALLNKN